MTLTRATNKTFHVRERADALRSTGLRCVRNILLINTMLAAGIALASCMTAVPAGPYSSEQLAAVREPLKLALKNFVDAATVDENYRVLGFRTAAEAKSSELGDPIAIYIVPLEKLRNYSALADPRELLTGGDRLTYPVLTRNAVRSSLTMAKVNGAWIYAKAGSPKFARRFFTLRSRDEVVSRVAADEYIEVSIPALNLIFLGRESGASLTLIPSEDYQGFGMRTGSSYPANMVFARLAAVARTQKSGPFN